MLGKRKIRKNVFNLLFGFSFNAEESALEYFNTAYDNFCCEDDEAESVKTLFLVICENLEDIDKTLEKYLQGWKIERLSKTILTIFRISIYEMLYAKLPSAISINEAVELAKVYCEDGACGYINGVLNAIAKTEIVNE